MQRLTAKISAGTGPRKRKAAVPLFRIHLSTAVVLMLVAGILLEVNLVPREEYVNESIGIFVPDFKTGGFQEFTHETWHVWGWPYTGSSQRLWKTVATDRKIDKDIVESFYYGPQPQTTEWVRVSFNIAVALIILITVAITLEFRIRHRKTALAPHPRKLRPFFSKMKMTPKLFRHSCRPHLDA